MAGWFCSERAPRRTCFPCAWKARRRDRVPRTVQQGKLVSNVHFSPDERSILYQVDRPEKEVGVYVQQLPGPALPKADHEQRREPGVGKERQGNRVSGSRPHLVGRRDSLRRSVSGLNSATAVLRPIHGRRSKSQRGITQLAVLSDGSRIYYQQPVEQPDSDVIHIRIGWDQSRSQSTLKLAEITSSGSASRTCGKGGRASMTGRAGV